MADYASLKVPELKKLLADKKLPQTGNKADLIARLHEDDKKNGVPVEVAQTTAQQAAKEDEITYTDDEEPESAPKVTETKAADDGRQDAQDKSEEQPAPAPVETAAQDTDEKDKDPSSGAAAGEAATSFALGLSTTAADAEAKKRADRAKRFGMEEDAETVKRADRAKRFGIDESALASSLDSALPERPLKRGRGRGGDDDARFGKRQNMGRRGDRQPRQNRNGGSARRGGVLDDPAEKAKAEKRAARFATA